jgi:cobalamin biosynthesis protein CbiG
MTNNTHAIITTVIKSLELLTDDINELEHAETEADEKRIIKATNKLKSALGMVREAYSIIDIE